MAVLLAAGIALFRSSALAAAVSTCAGSLSKLVAFNKAVGRRFPNTLNPSEMIPWLEEHVFHHQTLSEKGIQTLDAGRNPLASRWAREAMAASYGKLIDSGDLSADQKAELHEALRQAIAELAAKDRGLWEPEPKAGQPDRTAEQPATQEDFDRFLRSQALRRCLLRAGVLEGVSEGVTATVLLVKSWKEYAPKEASFIDQLTSPKTYTSAAQDHFFQLQMIRNGFLMGVMGALQCVPHRYLVKQTGVDPDSRMGRYVLSKKNLVAVVALASSVLGQKVVSMLGDDSDKKKNWFSWTQALFDVGFVRSFSVYKTDGVFWLGDLAKDRELADPMLLEGLMQAISEGTGAYLYARFHDLFRYLKVLPEK
jgi:hypothetical protein